MGTSNATTLVSPEFLERFRARAGGRGALTFAEFMDLALYDGRVGYYRSDRRRVGRAPGTDFYTAATSGQCFGELVMAACIGLLGGGAAATQHEFVELGAEPADAAAGGRTSGILAGVTHPFSRSRVVRVGEAPALTGRCVVFSNELFDAQPLRRFVRRGDDWRELGVKCEGTTLMETELNAVTAEWLPASAPEGYVFDAPRAAAGLAAAIAAQPWHGLFVACDYGKSWTALATETPAGTVRAYHRHSQTNELLARPGEQDLTGHVCWDWIIAALTAGTFTAVAVESQEAFFVHHAATWLERTLATETHPLSPRKRALTQLLHPAQMGQKFQVLHARREAASGP